MKKKELYEAMNYVNHSREKRMLMANLILDNPDLVGTLMEIAFDFDDPISSKACWVLEFTAKKDLRYLDQHLDSLIENAPRIRLDSSVRPMAKIYEFLILEYYRENTTPNYSRLNQDQLEKMATACFDWLIGEHKVAAKAYSMTCLYHLGKTFDWIHPELRMVLENEYHKGSAAFKARARHILAKLKQ